MKRNVNNIRKSFVHVFGGSLLTDGFLVKNLRFIIVVVLIIIVFISHRYTVLRKMSEAERLQIELKDVKIESITISSDLTEASRRGHIEKMIEQAGLDLHPANEPVYTIRKK